MRLYLLKRDDRVCFDEAAGFVVRASCPSEARLIASEHCGDEGPDMWLDAAVCEVLTETGSGGVVLRSFQAG